MNDYNELIENMRNNGDCITADIIEQLSINNDLLKKECDGLALQYGKCASNYTKLQIEYDILAKMYAKVNEDLCVRTRDRDDLERILSEVIKERDAAVADIEKRCWNCGRSFLNRKNKSPCKYAKICAKDKRDDYWQWRGVQEVTSNEID